MDVVEDVLFAPSVDATDLCRIVACVEALHDWDNAGQYCSEVKLDF